MGLCSDEDFEVRGHCPACGHASLFLLGNVIRCGYESCPNTAAAQQLLAISEIDHLVMFREGGFFTVQHPLVERADGSLFDCPIHNIVVEQIDLGLEPKGPGTYRLTGHGPVYIPGGPDQEAEWEWQEVD